jgi:hypothetical protein
MTLIPVVIPPEILKLKNATLPAKLVLALYHDNPDISRSRVIRATGLTVPGLRKLMQRLIAKGWLTGCKIFFDGRSFFRGKVHIIPELIHASQQLGSGHSVPENQTAEFEQKVAPDHPVTKLPAAASTLVIPGEVLDLRGVIASEKFVLSFYAAHPIAQNEQVFAALGVSRSGLKKVKNRLQDVGMLIKTDAGFHIRVPGLIHVDGPEGGHFMPETEAIKTGKIVAPLVVRKVRSCEAIWNEWQALIKKSCEEGSPAIVFAGITESFIERMKEEALESPERKAVLSIMKNKVNYYTSLQYVRNYCPKELQDDCVKMLKTFDSSKPEELTVLRERVERVLVAGGDPQNLIEFAGGARQLPKGKPRLQLMNAKVAPTTGGGLQG